MKIGKTDCGLLFLKRHSNYGVYSMNRRKAKKMVLFVLKRCNELRSDVRRNAHSWANINFSLHIIADRPNSMNCASIGCQRWSRQELEEICLYYGWEF